MKRCSFDPTAVQGASVYVFACPECGVDVMAGCPHPVKYEDKIEYDHGIVEWALEHRDD